MKIVIGSGHTTIELKNIIKEFVEGKSYKVVDLGANPTESCDYPMYDEKAGRAVADSQADLGIAIRGTGVDISLAVNKVKETRACACSEPYTAKLSRMYNNSGVFALGARVVDSEPAKMITETQLGAELEGGRHERGMNMITEVENRQDGTQLF